MLDNLNLIIGVRDLCFNYADLPIFITHNLDPCLSIGTQQSEASRHHDNWISVNNVSQSQICSDQIKVSSPIFVSNSWSSEGDNFNLGEDLFVRDVNVGNNSKPTSETYTCNIQKIQLGLNSNFSKIPVNILFNLLPHVVVGFLDFALITSVFVLDLKRIENILPDIQSSVGISKSQNDECGIDADNAFNVNSFLLDNMRVEGFVFLITHFTRPGNKIRSIISSNYQGVSKASLIIIRDGHGQVSQEQQNKCCFHDQVINLLQLYFQMQHKFLLSTPINLITKQLTFDQML